MNVRFGKEDILFNEISGNQILRNFSKIYSLKGFEYPILEYSYSRFFAHLWFSHENSVKILKFLKSLSFLVTIAIANCISHAYVTLDNHTRYEYSDILQWFLYIFLLFRHTESTGIPLRLFFLFFAKTAAQSWWNIL